MKLDIELKDVQRIGRLKATIGKRRGEFNSALVVNQKRYLRLAGMHRLLSRNSGINTRVFQDIEAAFDWLGFVNPLANADTSAISQ